MKVLIRSKIVNNVEFNPIYDFEMNILVVLKLNH